MPYLKQVCYDTSSCASYVLGCPTHGVCAVIDPKEEVSEYLQIAKENETRITHIMETHIHADHISGARKLSKMTGAPIYMHESADVSYDFKPLKDGKTADLGNARIKVVFTPGHTPESISLLYSDQTRGTSPWAVITGDTLFVGDVGRLDLVGAGTVDQMYDSVFNRLLELDDYVEVYPAHYAGSVCGKGMSMKTVSTVGFERKFNPALQFASLKQFRAYMKANAPTPFPQHRKIKAINAGHASSN